MVGCQPTVTPHLFLIDFSVQVGITTAGTQNIQIFDYIRFQPPIMRDLGPPTPAKNLRL
jgi:hypothetical protein